MAQNVEIDPTVLNLVTDFFNAQFRLKPAGPVLDTNNDSSNITDQHIRIALRNLGKAYISMFQERVERIIDELDLQATMLRNTFFSLSKELFAQGIHWHHIVTFFVFGAEFAYNANLRGLVSAEEVAVWLTQYISRELMPWIVDNGGWEGVVNFAQQTVNQPKPRRWPFTLLGGAAGALGVISLGLFLRQ